MKHFHQDGRPAVQLERTYPHPIERVWAAVTESKELEAWFPSKVEINGKRLRFYGDPNIGQDTFGEILVQEAPHRMHFSWGGGEVHFELESLGAEQTRLVLTQILEHENESARNAAGWMACLDKLDQKLVGHSAGKGWETYYEETQKQGFPSGAPVPASKKS